jgi:hypothetical protein
MTAKSSFNTLGSRLNSSDFKLSDWEAKPEVWGNYHATL